MITDCIWESQIFKHIQKFSFANIVFWNSDHILKRYWLDKNQNYLKRMYFNLTTCSCSVRLFDEHTKPHRLVLFDSVWPVYILAKVNKR